MMLLTSGMSTAGSERRHGNFLLSHQSYMITHVDTLLYIVGVLLFMPVFQQILQET